ncbi:uncharacterized protein LOC127080553 [Lathyrus oleraceus]|uniref:uncharacterized protein LOC127080553 n=1 Tax=Pisum sativum TaxID=3888 RepID=UPI0021D2E849|nr:uncharacterized protein LOC127080553 [Pisum sativum]
MTPLCWYDSGDNIVLGPETVQQKTKKVKVIQEKMKASQSKRKRHHNKKIKDLEFQNDNHVFLRVIPVTDVGRALKSKKFTGRFIGLYQITQRLEAVDYHVTLPPFLLNLHAFFHVSQLRKYVHDRSHVIHMDNMHVRDNLTVETTLVWITDREVKQLRGKKITLVKVIWGGPAGGSMTWELESMMKESYPELFSPCNF